MKKKALSIFAAGVIILLAACGKTDGTETPAPTATPAPTEAPAAEEPTKAPEATATAAPTATSTPTQAVVPTTEPTATATPTQAVVSTAEPTAEPTQIPETADTYEKGVVTETGFESKWMNLRFNTPDGASMVSQADLDAIMLQGAEWMYGEDAQAQLDYAALTTVTEMMAQNADGSNVLVQVEKLPLLYLLMTEEEYISAIVANLENSNAGIDVTTDENVYYLTIGGESYVGISTMADYGDGMLVYQDYIVRKKDGRMISIVFSYTGDSYDNVALLVDGFSGYDSEPAASGEQSAVTVGQYKGLTLTSVSQADVDAELEALLQDYIQYTEVDRTAAYGDTVNIDFVGKLDGVAFEGGTAEGYDLVLGSGSFIDGFEDGLVGTTAGQTLDLNLTFPEDYSSAELAGQAVVFTVTVNYILEEVVPELTDAFVADNFTGYATAEELVNEIRNALNQDSYYEQMTSLLMSSSVVNTYDEARVAEEAQNLILQYTSYAEYYGSIFGLDTESAIIYFLGYESVEAFEEDMALYAYEVVKNSMILEEIAALENLEVTEEIFNTKAAQYAVDYGYEDVESFIDAYGEEVIRDAFLADIVMEFVLDNAIILEAE